MRKNLALFSLMGTLLLASCGGPITADAAVDSQALAQKTFNPENLRPAALKQAEELPQVFSQMAALNQTMRSSTYSAQSGSYKAQTTENVYNPNGQLVIRLVITGPKALDVWSGERFDNEYSYALVGASATQDSAYLLGKGEELSAMFSRTLSAIGGKQNIKRLLSADLYNLMVETKGGKFYMLGEQAPMQNAQIKFQRELFGTILKGYQERPEAFEKNVNRWKADASNAKTGSNVGGLSFSQLSANFAGLTDASGNLDVEKAVGSLSGKLSAQSAELTPLALKAQGNDTYLSFNNYRNGQYLPIPAGGDARFSMIWGESDSQGNHIQYMTNALYSSWNAPTLMNMIGCAPAAAQSLLMHRWMVGYPAVNPATGQYETWRFKMRQVPGEPNMFRSNFKLYSQMTDLNNNDYHTRGDARAWMNDPHEFLTYKILNAKESGYNKSVLAMNAGYDGNAITTLPWNIQNGLNTMLGLVWPEMRGSNWVEYEWKTTGRGSSGMMRKIVTNALPSNRMVLAAYSTNGAYGHADAVIKARINEYWVWYGQVSDTFITSYDYNTTERNMTAINNPYSGLYTIAY